MTLQTRSTATTAFEHFRNSNVKVSKWLKRVAAGAAINKEINFFLNECGYCTILVSFLYLSCCFNN